MISIAASNPAQFQDWALNNIYQRAPNPMAQVFGALLSQTVTTPAAVVNNSVLLSYIAGREGLTYRVVPVTTPTWFGLSSRTTNYVDITYHGQTFRHSYRKVGENLVVSSQWLIDNFGFNEERARHQFGYDGDRFGSMDNAALAWGLRYWEEANRRVSQGGGEHAAWMYEDSPGSYFIGPHVVGTRNQVFLPLPNENFHAVASIHTHPRALTANRFSQDDLRATYIDSQFLERPIIGFIVTSNQIRSAGAEPRPHFAQPDLTRGFQTVDERTVFTNWR
jgi:hypothetical protein